MTFFSKHKKWVFVACGALFFDAVATLSQILNFHGHETLESLVGLFTLPPYFVHFLSPFNGKLTDVSGNMFFLILEFGYLALIVTVFVLVFRILKKLLRAVVPRKEGI